MRHFIRLVVHPGLLAGALWLALSTDNIFAGLLYALLGAQVLLRICETYWPAQPTWRQGIGDVATLIAITFFDYLVLGVIGAVYDSVLRDPLTATRAELTTLLWPGSWPLLAQIFLLFILSEGIFYWIHRGIHSMGWFWRLSGHGFHHSFHNLHALNFLAAHPLELVFLSLPAALMGALFNAPTEAVVCATLLATINGSVAHANIDSSPFMGWVFTTPEQHRRHHSQEYAASNSNYSCNVILWDRLFGTYTRGPVAQTGIGPTEPTLWSKFLLPLREPTDASMTPYSDPSAEQKKS